MKLRPYQEKAIEQIYELIRQGIRRILVVAPTGAGKTVLMAHLVKALWQKHIMSMTLVDREILLDQTHEKLVAYGVPEYFIGHIKAGRKPDLLNPVQIASVQTLARRNTWRDFNWQAFLLDEAHTTTFSTVCKGIFQDPGFANAYFLGFTATPYRLSKKEGLGDWYDAIVVVSTPKQLIDDGFLVKPIYYGLPTADLSKVHTLSGDFKEDELAVACNRPELVKRLVDEYKRLSWGKRAISFAVDVAHAKSINEAFQNEGILSDIVTAEVPIPKRNEIYERLKTGELWHVSSVNALSIGFDCVEAEVAILARPTQSRAMYIQQVGRVLRPSPHTGKKNAIIIDQAGNVDPRFGFIESITRFSLLKGKGDDFEPGEAPTKKCSACNALLHLSARECSECGYIYPEKEKITQSGELVELTEEKVKTRKKEREAKKKIDYQPTEAFKKFIDPFIEEMKANNWSGSYVTGKLYGWKGYLGIGDFLYLQKELGFKPGWAYFQHQKWKNRA